jgi:tRNA-(ms[2]io[6]A)-hydroxylase
METTMLSEIRHSLPLRSPTDPAWVEVVTSNVNAFLADHASCERKAHAGAMMIVSKFPEYPELQEAMIALAIEELEHFQMIFKRLRQQGVEMGSDDIDTYVKELMKHVRHPRREHLQDRLLVAAVVEARSCERFCLLADHLPEGELKSFYTEFAKAESQHFPLFVNLSKSLFGEQQTVEALERWLDIEATIVQTLPHLPKVH